MNINALTNQELIKFYGDSEDPVIKEFSSRLEEADEEIQRQDNTDIQSVVKFQELYREYRGIEIGVDKDADGMNIYDPECMEEIADTGCDLILAMQRVKDRAYSSKLLIEEILGDCDG